MGIFISFSGAAREQYAIKFLNFFDKHGIKSWYDHHELLLGDDLKQTIINEGISKSDYSIIIINKTFLDRDWPCIEAKLLYERYQTQKDIVIFPILLDLTKEDLQKSQLNFFLKIKYQFLISGEPIDKIGYQILNRIFADILKKKQIKPFDEMILEFKRLTMYDSINIFNVLTAINECDSTNYRDKTIFLVSLIKLFNINSYEKVLRIISYKIYNKDMISFDIFKITESIFLLCATEYLAGQAIS